LKSLHIAPLICLTVVSLHRNNLSAILFGLPCFVRCFPWLPLSVRSLLKAGYPKERHSSFVAVCLDCLSIFNLGLSAFFVYLSVSSRMLLVSLIYIFSGPWMSHVAVVCVLRIRLCLLVFARPRHYKLCLHSLVLSPCTTNRIFCSSPIFPPASLPCIT
jgi:hypothetical protein